MRLVVVQPFAGHAVGAEITEPDQVTAVLDGENALHVVRVSDDQPADQPDAQPKEAK